MQKQSSDAMTDEFKAYIRAIFRFCLSRILHSEYTTIFKWQDKAHPDDVDNESTKMQIKVNSVYLYATIWIYPQMLIAWDNKDYAEIGCCVLHEVCHLFIEPVALLFMWDACASQKQNYKETIERQTQRITNALLDHFPKDWYVPPPPPKRKAR